MASGRLGWKQKDDVVAVFKQGCAKWRTADRRAFNSQTLFETFVGKRSIQFSKSVQQRMPKKHTKTALI
jgi:hypothetical protein